MACSVLFFVTLANALFITWLLKSHALEVNELHFSNEEEDKKIDWSEVKPTSVQAMTRRIHRLVQIIKHMDDTVAENIMYLIEEEGGEVLEQMLAYSMSLDNLSQFIDEFTNITIHYGKALLDRGPPKWIPAYFEPEATFKSFNWTKSDLDKMYELDEVAKKAYSNFSEKLRKAIESTKANEKVG